MAGHSHWAGIKHRKGRADKQRSKIFSKISKEITVAAKLGSKDPDMNPRLRSAIQAAKVANMPKDNIERAINKSEINKDLNYNSLIYEGFGPGGVAIMMDVITDNKNRSVADIRHLLAKYKGNLGESGSVSWIFDKKGQIIVSSESNDEEIVFDSALEAGAEDFQIHDDIFIISTKPELLMKVRDALESQGYNIISAEIDMVPNSFQKLDGQEADRALDLLNTLEDNEDVNKLYSNFDFN